MDQDAAQAARIRRSNRRQGWLMLAVLAVIVGIVGYEVATKNSGSTNPPTNAEQLQSFDADHGHPGDEVSAYDSRLADLVLKCTDYSDSMVTYIENSYLDLVAHGVKDETALTVLQHLDASIPQGSRIDCRGTLAAYLVLRES